MGESGSNLSLLYFLSLMNVILDGYLFGEGVESFFFSSYHPCNPHILYDFTCFFFLL
uniref:E3 SUMO-protein ligase SIZ1 isoform X1 n=1 Tax=Rhizophora mucronata TaxID=61149 RepID=A0A2P2KGM6_RHIMU